MTVISFAFLFLLFLHVLATAEFIGPNRELITGNELLSLILFSDTASNCQSLLWNPGRETALLPQGNNRSLVSHSCFFSSQLPHSSHLPPLEPSVSESSEAFDFSKAVARLIQPCSSPSCQPLASAASLSSNIHSLFRPHISSKLQPTTVAI
jgi:hypothetical protein